MTRASKAQARRYDQNRKEKILTFSDLLEILRWHYDLDIGANTITVVRALVLDAGWTFDENQIIPLASKEEDSQEIENAFDVTPKDRISDLSRRRALELLARIQSTLPNSKRVSIRCLFSASLTTCSSQDRFKNCDPHVHG
jgi:hypothetical protein